MKYVSGNMKDDQGITYVKKEGEKLTGRSDCMCKDPRVRVQLGEETKNGSIRLEHRK